MIKNNQIYLIVAFVFYIFPILIFGNLSNFYNIGVMVLSTILMWFFVNYKAIESKEWPFYVVTFILGASLSYLGLDIAKISLSNPTISISVNLMSIPAIISIIGVCFFSGMYRKIKKSNYLKQFEGNAISLERDKKINKILGGFQNF